MARFNTGQALNSMSELEKQQKEMLEANKRKNEIFQNQSSMVKTIENEKIELVKPTAKERITLRLPEEVHNSMKLIGKFEDKSLNAIIVQACYEFLAKTENQEKIKKYNKLI